MEYILELIKIFSDHYANSLTAVATLGILVLSCITLYYVQREYFTKYRPYVIPVVEAKRNLTDIGCSIDIIPKNVGAHPCKFKLTNIKLLLGDEPYETPSFQQWMLLGPHGVGFKYPAGFVNPLGIEKIQNNQYKSNRIELSFSLHTTSIHDQFSSIEHHSFEIDVKGNEPQALSRPEWINKKI